jgi:hypothetical protein
MILIPSADQAIHRPARASGTASGSSGWLPWLLPNASEPLRGAFVSIFESRSPLDFLVRRFARAIGDSAFSFRGFPLAPRGLIMALTPSASNFEMRTAYQQTAIGLIVSKQRFRALN